MPDRGRSLPAAGRVSRLLAPGSELPTEPMAQQFALPPGEELRYAPCEGLRGASVSPRTDPAIPRRGLENVMAALAGSAERNGVSPGAYAGRRKLPQEVDQMATGLDQKVTQILQAEGARVRMLMDQASKLAEGIQAMRVSREIAEERRHKELKMLENNAQQDLITLKEDRRDLETRLQERGERLTAERREEMQHYSQTCSEDGDYVQEISDQVYRLTGILEEQRAAREEYGERIRNSLDAEFQKVEDAIVAENHLHAEAKATMEKMVQDMGARMSGELQQERVQRQAVQSKLLGLLEDTCGRLETSFSGGGGRCEPQVVQRPVY